MAISAQTVVDRIRQQCGVGWRTSEVDAFVAGRPGDEVKGVATTYAPSLEVLHKAVASGKNMVVSLESPYWLRPAALLTGGTSPSGVQEGPPGYRPPPGAIIANEGTVPAIEDALAAEKRAYIAANNLIIYRFYDNWFARQPDPALGALVTALGWQRTYRPAQGVPWATRNAAFVDIPTASLRTTAQTIKRTLKMGGSMRIIGEPETRVSRAAVSHGISLLIDLERYFGEPGVDLVVMGEPVWQNEGAQYVADLVSSGQKKGLIMLGQEVSREPGCGAMAAWLKTFVNEVPVEWIPTGDPSWMPA